MVVLLAGGVALGVLVSNAGAAPHDGGHANLPSGGHGIPHWRP
jgi:hypothetical protein